MADTAALMKRAEEAFAKKNYDYARDLFLSVLTIDPNSEKARKSLYATCLSKIKEQGAKSKITTVILKGKIEAQLAATKDPVKKMELAQKYLCDEPNDARVRTALAQALVDTGNIIGAGAEAECALNVDGKNLIAAKILCSSLTSQNKIAEAQKILDRVSAHAGEDRDIAKLQRDLAAKQTMKKGFEDAKSYQDIVKNKDQAALLEAQHHLIQTDEQFQAVIANLKEEMSENPTDAKYPKKIADLFFEKKKDFNEAREWYKKASSLAPQDTVLRDKVDDCTIRIWDVQIEAAQKNNDPKLAQLKTERLKFVIQSFERRVADRPTDMVLRFELGKAYYIAGPAFLNKAMGEFQQSVKDPKKKMESHIFLGHGFRKLKNYAQADTQYAKAEESGVLQQNLQLDIWYNRAVCCFEAGKKEQAVALANKIIEVDINYKDIGQLIEKWQNGS
jgi:tetratricopeptide (TPR) repeat protein